MGSKLIEDYLVTDASVHDSIALPFLLDELDENMEIYADSAYRSEEIEEKVKTMLAISQINEKGYKNKPLTEQQKANNKTKSKKRARIEHVFAHMTHCIGGTLVRSIGKARARVNIAMLNLTYNIQRFVSILLPKNKKTAMAG